MKFTDFVFLAEANVFNVTQPYKDITVHKYVTKLFQFLPAGQVRDQLTKKFVQLIINDDTLLSPIRVDDLPTNAPPWAKTAAQAGNLAVFIPKPETTDRIEHIIHYIGAVSEDTKSNVPDVKTFAVRELAGLYKAENFNILLTKANEYFARGSHAAARDVTGMEHILDAPGGYKWYKLTTQEGFQREGKLLQNCIGRVYTAASCAASNTQVYVLRDRNNNSSVAIRVVDDFVHEVKGKNNQPPVSRYMPAVQYFLNHTPVQINNAGARDIKAAGYFLVGKEVVTREEAIQRLTKITPMDPTPSGYSVDKVKYDTFVIYLELAASQSTQDHSDLKIPCITYRMHIDANDDVVVYITPQQVLYDVWTTPNVPTPAIVEFLQYLRAKKLYTLTDAGIKKRLVFRHNINQDSTTGNAEIQHSTISVTEDDKVAKVRVFGADQAQGFVDVIQGLINNDSKEYRRYNAAAHSPEKNIKVDKMYVLPNVRRVKKPWGDEYDEYTTCAVESNGVLFPYSYKNAGEDIEIITTMSADEKTANHVVALANQVGKQLPLYWCSRAGVTKTPTGLKHVELPTKKSTDGKFLKIDLTNHSPVDKYITIIDSFGLEDIQHGAKRKIGDRSMGYGFHAEEVLRGTPLAPLDPNTSGQSGVIADMAAPGYPSDQELVSRWKTTVAKVFGGTVPSYIYTRGLNSERHAPMSCWVAVDDNKNILHIELFATKIQQYRRKEVDLILKTLNHFISSEGLTVGPKAVKSKVVKVINNQILSPTMVSQVAISSRSSENIEFKDGAIIRAPTAEEFEKWAYNIRDISVKDKVPYFVVPPGGGDPIAAILLAKNGTMIRVYSAQTEHAWDERQREVGLHLPIHPMFSKEAAKYIRRFAQLKNISPTESGGALLTTKSIPGRWLKALSDIGAPAPRGTIMNELGISQSSAAGYDHSGNQYDKALVQSGLVNLERRNNRLIMSITPKGREVLAQLDAAGTKGINVYDLTPPAELKDEKAAAQAAPAPAPAARAEPVARVAGVHTKSSMAMDKFRELAAGGDLPPRSQFIGILQAPPFNMSAAGASTYYHNIRVKYAQEQGQLGEHFTLIEYLMLFE